MSSWRILFTASYKGTTFIREHNSLPRKQRPTETQNKKRKKGARSSVKFFAYISFPRYRAGFSYLASCRHSFDAETRARERPRKMNTAVLEINFHSARRIERSWERVDEEASKTIAVVIQFPMRPYYTLLSPYLF